MRIVRLTKEQWKELSEQAHLVVFSEIKRADSERLDFALLLEANDSTPMAYATCVELDSESLFIQYGGAFPGTKNSPYTYKGFQAGLRWCKEAGYARLGFYVENKNLPMLKMAIKAGAVITGVRNFKGKIFLEHVVELANG